MRTYQETPGAIGLALACIAAGCMPTDVDFAQSNDIDGDCETISATITIRSAADSRALPQRCFNVIGSVNIVDSDLTDLEPLRLLRGTENLRIENNAALASTAGLQRVIVSKALVVVDNPSLTRLVGFDTANKIGELVLDGNSVLDDVESLASLEQIDDDFALKSNGAVSDLKAFDDLETVGGDFKLEDNGGLRKLGGLNSLQAIGGDLIITDNRDLTALEGFSRLKTVGANLIIERNQSLTITNGFSNALESVGADLTVNDNVVLNDVFDLAFNLFQVGGSLTVTNNPALSQCREDDFEQYIEVIAGDLDIGDNGTAWDPCH